MIVSGLLVTLAGTSGASGAECRSAVGAMRLRAGLTVGDLNGRWLPVALEARDDAHSRELHDWIGALPGVEFVDVVSVSFDDGDDQSPAEARLAAADAIIRDPRPSRPGRAAVPHSALND